jgi:methionyl-tRNA synthetase
LGTLSAPDIAILDQAKTLTPKVRDAIDRLAFHEALEEIWKLVRAANAYIDHQAPWALRKTDTTRMETVLRVLLETIRTIAILLQPFMPDSMARLLDQLGIAPDARQIAVLTQQLTDATPLPAPSGIFPRHVEAAA